jgi:hypothetical protein
VNQIITIRMEDDSLDAEKKASFRKGDFEFGDELGEGAYGRVCRPHYAHERWVCMFLTRHLFVCLSV